MSSGRRVAGRCVVEGMVWAWSEFSKIFMKICAEGGKGKNFEEIYEDPSRKFIQQTKDTRI